MRIDDVIEGLLEIKDRVGNVRVVMNVDWDTFDLDSKRHLRTANTDIKNVELVVDEDHPDQEKVARISS